MGGIGTRNKDELSVEDRRIDELMSILQGICVHENPDQTVKQLLKDTDIILKNIDVYKEVVKKNKLLRKELKWIIEESKGQRETSRIVDLIKKGVRDVCVSEKYRDCSEMRSKRRGSGIYTIYPEKSKGIKVYCDMTDGKGWTVIQRRIDGSTDFRRTWNEYKEGFGDVRKEYWFGNKYLNILTSSGKYELRVDLVDTNHRKTYAVYKTFVVGDENSKYKLTVGDYTGTAGDRMNYNNGKYFTTKDRDNDSNSGNCATDPGYGPWWNGNCSHVALNLDLKKKKMRWSNHNFINAVMKIRKIN
ncbi:Fibrinogen-like protein A,Ryncolin-4,Angiopoietin-related protein 7,Angiopoietin-related protein 1,Ficolin-3,Ficolin-1-B,Ficolin-2,Ryncolin-1,Tenascin-R,Fibrinogen-like protein 1,Angiopoietin-1,Tenascin-X,Fibrinogen C domain-containing protein 1-A,Tenascin-N,Ryncolin-3,Tenascin,Fibroleukin,Fibrinogen C domain-containing protein 1,Ryncolin-2,Angiopoietin-related protein 6,Techylectin-5B,Angiopoietin-related protein 2,Angiopoietin-2,Microfibril-associated glycoprotein 4,Ficolin-1-A,Ficolin-1,Fibrinogen C dom|uniref:Fibrinogen C-terminal domain-containing protein n=1 Tax=Mytilus coruscus TaxID=42192 RepID=A0A6J8B1G0_MYTCO|nr:Fibrinogen-like protein A,Ryncolin-4,Angiopoietin-related protein 7,Angiopoietin-related protein 1,Ficolin-3,Ficolin-1-B,Ficolin-2,Ryncolin-1,Tenascin-R,Fibrinogen-like protein 1,Angiopoietin-1,Tenascin-X,Fibrinogen C domain-containing protein 1-A,Tenascin-N,Ryncolin-3,Tenascin,Fibroleukin,Fibrinogen C domain-containing protein 1,Ryncolin-2,Angiopoietin-related protein 6,Techylectin-5B,Angiopoietin-related protein 2,Angiopoietin-2,Microfibril-associated glycoprotein 4,Ficolin-1-A,Ficolin-1,Fibri